MLIGKQKMPSEDPESIVIPIAISPQCRSASRSVRNQAAPGLVRPVAARPARIRSRRRSQPALLPL